MAEKCMLYDYCNAFLEGACTQEHIEEFCHPVTSEDISFILVRRGQMMGLSDNLIWAIFQRIFPTKILASG